MADAEVGPGRRELLEGDAGRLYREVLAAGVLPDEDARIAAGSPGSASFATLCEAGLLRRDEALGGWVACDPATVQAGLVAPLSREALELLEESAAWAQTIASLSQAFRAQSSHVGGATTISGLEHINRYLESAVDDARSELLTAQPLGPRQTKTLEVASSRDLRALERGVRMRTLYQHTARRSHVMRPYVERMTALGAQFRTLDEFFNRLIVIDRRTAVIPGDTLHTAVVIDDRPLVAYLVDIFERFWERGRDFEQDSRVGTSEIAAEVRQLTVRMLTEGHSDSASAKRVGVSTRTYASYVAALKQEYGVDTRFQLGLAMGREAAGSAPESVADPASSRAD